MAMIQYPKHPRAVISKRSAYGKRVVAAACRRQLDTDSIAGTSGYLVAVQDLWQMAFGEHYQLWYLHAYATELCQWELGTRRRRPSSMRLKMSEANFIAYIDKIQPVFLHWVALVEAAKAQGNQASLFDSLPAELIRQLNDADAGIEGIQLSTGGPEQNKRPSEERPEIKPLFDDELGRQLAVACDKQRAQPICDGRTVQDCLYFPLADVIERIQGMGMSFYILDRIHWLIGTKARRPQWGSMANPDRMREHDDFASRLLGHWLALHEALSPTGEIDLTKVESLLFKERILLTDVESLSGRDDLVVIHEARQAYQVAIKSARGRLSGLAERVTLRAA